MPGNEIIQSRPASRDLDGSRTFTRVWKVWGVSTSDVINDPSSVVLTDGSTLPAVGTSMHGLMLRSYSAEPSGQDIITVRALYSNDARYSSPPKAPILPPSGTLRESASPVSTTVRIPFAVAVPNRISTGPGTPPIDVTTWSYQTEDVPITFYRWRYEVQCPREAVAIAFESAQAQARKLHQFGDNRYYAFEAPEMRQVSDDLYTLTYSWLYDPGNPDSEDDNDPSTEYPVGLSHPLFLDTYVRPPYCVVKLNTEPLVGPPAPGQPTTTITFRAKMQYDTTNPAGWTSLYGLA